MLELWSSVLGQAIMERRHGHLPPLRWPELKWSAGIDGPSEYPMTVAWASESPDAPQVPGRSPVPPGHACGGVRPTQSTRAVRRSGT